MTLCSSFSVNAYIDEENLLSCLNKYKDFKEFDYFDLETEIESELSINYNLGELVINDIFIRTKDGDIDLFNWLEKRKAIVDC